MFEQRIKESPIIGLNGMGGGVTSYILYSAASSGSYEVSRSLRFKDGDSAYLDRTPGAGNRKTWTWAAWVKKSESTRGVLFGGGTTQSDTQFTSIEFESDDTLRVTGWNTLWAQSNALFRDYSAWMHVVISFDSTQSSASDQIKMYVNGQQLTKATENALSQNTDYGINQAVRHTIGAISQDANPKSDFYLADVHFVDGQALAATNFGELDSNNVWQPKAFNGSHGSNGYHLKFDDNSSDSALGTDSSGNNNNWSVNNIKAVVDGLTTADQGFDVVTYTGNHPTGQSITNLNFSPDLIWIKDRSGGNWNYIFDSVRGTENAIFSNAANAENTYSNTLTSFDSNGFTLGSDNACNNNGSNYVGWCWKAGGTASSNTDGTETTSVSANTTYGFSVVTYTGTSSADTFGHGLGAVPRMIFFKARNAATNWQVYHDDGTNKRIFEGLNTGSNGSTTINSMSSVPSSTLLSLEGGGYSINSSGTNMVAYCWSEISGFSKFGTYTGDSPGGVTNTVTITTGFKPNFIIIKRVSNGSDGDTSYGGWGLYSYDTSSQLMANCSGAEGTRGNCSGSTNIRSSITFNDDGFSVGTPWYELNDDNVVYVYAAFAEKPDQSVIDSLIDTPTNYSADSGNNGGNYATLNPLAISPNSTPTVSNGNLDIELASSGSFWTNCGSTIAVSSGKYYWEVNLPTINGTIARWGVADADDYEFNRDTAGTGLPWLGSGTGSSWSMDVGGNTYHNGSTVSSSYTSTVTTGDVIGVALDCDANTLTFYKNGTSLGVAHSNVTASRLVPAVSLHGSGTNKVVFNFGQRPFVYTPPSNHLSICTQNLSDPSIGDGSNYFEAKTYTGTGGTNAQTGLNFSPDLLWLKRRNGTNSHVLFDEIRGVTKAIESSNTDAEKTNDPAIASFDTNGFTVNGTFNQTNAQNQTYVAWAWNGGTTNAANTDGGTSSTVRANTAGGFSIVKWTNPSGSTTVGHGLGIKPQMIMTKGLGSCEWQVYHHSIGNNYKLYLDANNAQVSSSVWGTTDPTSTLFTFDDNRQQDFIAYCFSPVSAYNFFGSYVGNGASSGPFVYTGHLSRFVMIKRYDSTGDWIVYDTAREEVNTMTKRLYPSEPNAEADASDHALDILSNGFKIRGGNNANFNASGGNYVFASFATHPFKTSRAR